MYKWQTQAIADLDILVSVDSIAPYLDSIFFFSATTDEQESYL